MTDRLPFVAAVAGGTAVMTGLLIALPRHQVTAPQARRQCAWYSTDSLVSCMKASSSEPR